MRSANRVLPSVFLVAAFGAALFGIALFGSPLTWFDAATGASAAEDGYLTPDEARETARAVAQGFIDHTRASEDSAPERRGPRPTVNGHLIGIADMKEVEAQFISEQQAKGPVRSAVTGSWYPDGKGGQAAWLFVFQVEGLSIPEWKTEEGLYEVEVVISAKTGKTITGGVGLYPIPHSKWVPNDCIPNCELRTE